MAIERSGAFQLMDQPVTLVGPELKPGDPAPDFTVIGADMQPVNSAEFSGKVRIISAVPSLDTPVCDAQTQRFNEAAAQLGESVVVLSVSMDLPFAQRRWCGTTGADNIIALSDHRDAAFTKAYGTLIKEVRLSSRAVFVIDRSDRIVHAEYVPVAGQHPDYDAALAAARQAAQA